MASKNFSVLKTGHTGITVSSLSAALQFWEGLVGAEVVYRVADAHMHEQMNVVGLPDAVLSVALLRLPDGSQIELLEYSKPEDRKVFKPRACDIGSVHVALDVVGSKALITEAAKLGWRAVDEPQHIKRGDGSDWTAVYIFGPDGEAVELMERIEK